MKSGVPLPICYNWYVLPTTIHTLYVDNTHGMDNAYPGDPVHADEGEHQDEDQGDRADDADIVDPTPQPRWG